MAIVDIKKYKHLEKQHRLKLEKLEMLDTILKRQVILKGGMSMMYVSKGNGRDNGAENRELLPGTGGGAQGGTSIGEPVSGG